MPAKKKSPIIRLDQSIRVADGVRALCTPDPASRLLGETVVDLAKMLGDSVGWALFGALAVGIYSRPRGTDEIEIVLTANADIPSVIPATGRRFRQIGSHTIEHRSTHIAVRLVTPELILADPVVFAVAICSAIRRKLSTVKVPIVSREGLVAVSLCRGEHYDLAHVAAVTKIGSSVDLSGYPLTGRQKDAYLKVLQEGSA